MTGTAYLSRDFTPAFHAFRTGAAAAASSAGLFVHLFCYILLSITSRVNLPVQSISHVEKCMAAYNYNRSHVFSKVTMIINEP